MEKVYDFVEKIEKKFIPQTSESEINVKLEELFGIEKDDYDLTINVSKIEEWILETKNERIKEEIKKIIPKESINETIIENLDPSKIEFIEEEYLDYEQINFQEEEERENLKSEVFKQNIISVISNTNMVNKRRILNEIFELNLTNRVLNENQKIFIKIPSIDFNYFFIVFFLNFYQKVIKF
jgi:hypothetical protein